MISTVKAIPSQRQHPVTMLSIPVHLNALTSNSAKPTKRRVRFSPSVTVQPIDCKMTQFESSNSFYSMAELDAMKLEAKALYAKPRDQSIDLDTPSSTSRLVDPMLRGFELKSCRRRVWQKVLSTNALLKYQQALASDPLNTKEERLLALAAASSKLSQSATLTAVETARLDSIQAFSYDYLVPINNEPVLVTPFLGQKKRRRISSEATEVLTRNFPKPDPGQKKRRRLPHH